jgi:outer membrane protein, multidrug efflux system
MIPNILFKGILIVTILLASSCKILKPVKMPEKTSIPENFTGGTGESIGKAPIKEFFPDHKLVTLIDHALANNLDLKIAHQRIEIARAQLMFSRNALLPSIGLNTSAGVRKYGDYTMDGVGNFDTNLSDNIGSDKRIPNPVKDYFLGLQSSWEIDIWGKLRNQKKSAFARFMSSQQGKNLLTTELVSEIASFYYELLALDAELDIIRKNVKLQETAVEMINIQKEGGRATELAVKQFSAQLVNTKALEYQVSQEIVRIENIINYLIGRFPQPIDRENSIQNQSLPLSGTGVPSEMLQRRPDIIQAELELVAAKADLKAARAAFLPSLRIDAHTGLNAFNSAVLLSPASLAYGAVAGLATPIFNQRALMAGFNINVSGNFQAHYNYQKTILNGYREVITNLKRIENYQKINQLKTEEVEMLQDAVAISRDLYFAGYASYLEVITAQKSVLEAEIQQNLSKKEQLISTIELYRALGGGWE